MLSKKILQGYAMFLKDNSTVNLIKKRSLTPKNKLMSFIKFMKHEDYMFEIIYYLDNLIQENKSVIIKTKTGKITINNYILKDNSIEGQIKRIKQSIFEKHF